MSKKHKHNKMPKLHLIQIKIEKNSEYYKINK